MIFILIFLFRAQQFGHHWICITCSWLSLLVLYSKLHFTIHTLLDLKLTLNYLLQKLLVHCREGEYCRLFMKSIHCYGAKGCSKYGIGPHKDLMFYLRIKQMEQVSVAR